MNPSEGQTDFKVKLDLSKYHPPFYFLAFEPANIITHDKPQSFRLSFSNISGKTLPEGTHTVKDPVVVVEYMLLLAKIAYCCAVSKKGLSFFDSNDIRDLILGRRDDVFNFVGGYLGDDKKFSRRRLHAFYFRERDSYLTVVLHLFANIGGPVYEVVVGKILSK